MSLANARICSVYQHALPRDDPSLAIAQRKKDITGDHVIWGEKMVLKGMLHGVELIKREIAMCRPTVIIAMGNLALLALTGQYGITKWRGSQMKLSLDVTLPEGHEVTVIPVIPIRMIQGQQSWRMITVQDLRRARDVLDGKRKKPDYHFIVRPTFEKALSILRQLLVAADAAAQAQIKLKLASDIETRAGHIACQGIAWSRTDAICIPIMCVERASGYWTAEEELELQWHLHLLLTHPAVEVVGQNYSYDAQFIWKELGYIPNLVRDTMLMQHTNFSSMQKSLDFICSLYNDWYCYWKDDGKVWDAHTGEDQLWSYNCEDACNTFQADEHLCKLTTDFHNEGISDFQQALFWPVFDTMQHGIRISKTTRNEFAQSLILEIEQREAWLDEVIGQELNYGSPKQLQEYFYDVLNQKTIVNRKTGSVTANEEALRKMAEREPILRPVVGKLLELRSLGVFLSTFVQAKLDPDGRMRTSFNIGGTETFRFSSSKNPFGAGLNFQNIPAGGDMQADGIDFNLTLPNIRTMFEPDPGHTFFDIDLGSADLRIVVWESDEQEMKAMLREGKDPYTEVAKEFYKDPGITKKDHRRQLFKSFCHGTHYLGTPKGLAERLGLLVHEAERTQKWYFGRFPGIPKWQARMKHTLETRRYVENIFGYKVWFFDRIEGNVYNQAAAALPQSTVACIINRGYMRLFRYHKPLVQVLLQVHDSLGGQFLTRNHAPAVEAITQACSVALPYADPLTIPVDVNTSQRSWGHCK